jgi:addiction module HigA family antidote
METRGQDIGFRPPHPGEILREDVLPGLGMTAAEFARHLGVSKQTVSGILNEKRALSTEMAVRLGQALRNGARFWLALQLQHELWVQQTRGGITVAPLDWSQGDEAA